MLRTFKRNGIHHFSVMVSGRRLRGSLGTKNPEIARKLANQLEYAAASGPQSDSWSTLRLILPPSTVSLLNRALVGPAPSSSLQEIERAFCLKLDRQLKLGRLASGTVNTYEHCVQLFVEWVGGRVRLMDELTANLLEQYFLERLEQIKATKQATNGSGILTDFSAVRRFIQFCVEEKFMPPIKLPEAPKVLGEVEGAEPFTSDEIERIGQQARGIALLAYLLLRWTGLRGQDVVALTWKEIDLTAQRITRVTQKCRKLVIIPMAPPLLEELTHWHNLLSPEEKDRVLPNITRDKLSRMMLGLGSKAGVEGANLHRYRANFVVYLLEKEIPIYDISKIVGDTIFTLERAYGKFTDKMQGRVRGAFNGDGNNLSNHK